MSRLPQGPRRSQRPWIKTLIKFAISLSLGFTFGWSTNEYRTVNRTELGAVIDTAWVEAYRETVTFRTTLWDTIPSFIYHEVPFTTRVVREEVIPRYEVVFDTVEVGGEPQEAIPAWFWRSDRRRPGDVRP